MSDATRLRRRLTRERRARLAAQRLLRHSGRQRSDQDAGLGRERIDLEGRVRARFEQLDDINAALREQIAVRRGAELALHEAKSRAEVADAAKGEFLAVMSHEIRTPLNALIGMVELAAPLANSREQSGYLRRALQNADALLHLLNDILDMSKIEAGGIALAEEPFDPIDLVEEVVESLAIRAPSGGPVLVCETPGAPHHTVVGDPARLRQVLVNLVGNALKFTPVGEVRVRLEYGAARGDRIPLVFTVHDTGVGIREKDLARIFDRFDRGENARCEGGTGLGLSIARSLTQLMEGDIRVESTQGHGSTFEVALELPREGAKAVTSPTVGRVLYIDSHATSRQAMARRLGDWQLEFDVRASTELVTRTELSRYALVILADREGDHAPAVLRQTLSSIVPTPQLMLAMGSPSTNSEARQDTLAMPITGRSLRCAIAPSAQPDGRGGGLGANRNPLRHDHQGPWILLAEDNQDSRGFLARVLEREGYRVDTAPDGLVALEKAAVFQYDLIISDLQMPRMDGLIATQRIRAFERDNGRPPVPIVALSAHALGGYRERSLEAGMNAFVAKPARTSELIASVQQWVKADPVLLLVEDHEDSRLVATHMLSDCGMEVVCAASGSQALEVVRRRRISVMVTDMNLPDFDGTTLISRVHGLPRTASLPILALTGDCGPAARQRSLDAGCLGHMEKPIERSTILETLAPWLRAGGTGGAGSSTPQPGNEAPPASAPEITIDPELADLIPGFMANRRDNLAALTRQIALSPLPWKSLARIGHDLKGCGTSYGFSGISEIGAELELSALNRNSDEVRQAVRRLESYLAQAHSAIRKQGLVVCADPQPAKARSDKPLLSNRS